METTDIDAIKKHTRVYINVFLGLMVLTVLTVAVSYLHLPIVAAVAIALIIATVKASLVAGFFMHLISEKRLIYATLILTVVFLVALFGLPLLGYADRLGDFFHWGGAAAPAAGH